MQKNNIWQILLLILAFLLAIVYFATGVYLLQNGQHAVIVRFGKAVYEVSESGVHYHLPPPIERAVKVYVSKVQMISVQEQKNERIERLTGDENLIRVYAAISYDVKDLTEYLFNMENVESIIRSVGQNCLSQKLAAMNIDDVMTTGKSLLRLVMKERVQHILDQLETGVRVISIELTDIAPPMEVSQSFKAVSDAREQKQQIIKEAEGYANEKIPEARGKADSIITKAEAYAKEVDNFVNGRVSAFDDLLAEYQRNPEITKKLKYLETMQTVSKRSQITIDPKSSQSIYYIDQNRK
jgi:membrane protease subunit HflK